MTFRLLIAAQALLLIGALGAGGVPAQSASGPSAPKPSLIVRDLDSPAGPGSAQPNIYPSPDGRFYLSWLEPAGEGRHAFRFAVRGAGGWSEPRTITEGNDLLVNWADFPSLVAGRGGELIAHWAIKGTPGTHASSIRMARSRDGGRTWGKPFIPHADRSETEHGFVSLMPMRDGRIAAVWLDGREMKEGSPGGHGHATGDMSLRFTMVGRDGNASEDLPLDLRVCECCQTSGAATSDGAIVVYRDRSEDETRDISAVRFSRGKWTEPQGVSADGWKISGCPVNGPSVAADGKRVAVAWFTAAGETPRVRVAFSDDAGASFGKPVQVDDAAPVGRVNVLMLPDGAALVSWLERTASGAEVRVRRVAPNGSRDGSLKVAESNAARVSGFPRMARAGDEIVIAWTEPGASPRVRTAIIKYARK
ncbi:MAG TPA: sialidase family protein [Blastocatellia bacterium]|nr:sialidase family protein [Blastocatellia bacterium]